ncbi:protein kinase [bacterium]|nr:protein kinase [bacterium]
MYGDRFEDDLVQRLAEAEDRADPSCDSEIRELDAALDQLSGALKAQRLEDPYLLEPEFSAALSRATSLAEASSLEHTRLERSALNLNSSPSTKVFGQYELLEELGSGGMGQVFRARHTKLGRIVAIKMLPADRFQSADAVARFEREMRAVGLLQHPHIVTAHDAGEIDGRHFLVMEFVAGEDLTHLLARTGPLPVPEVCEMGRQTALGLQHIQENQLVHRDIKPSNLMLVSPRHAKAQPTIKILDLGLALLGTPDQISPGELTSTGQVMGTVDYMAPEQALDTHHVDIRADLYSLGATLFKLLTGRAPLEDPTRNTVMKRLLALDREQPPRLSTLRGDCPAGLCDLIERLLAKSPDGRPTEPHDVAEELARFAVGADLRRLLEPSSEPLPAVLLNPAHASTIVNATQHQTTESVSRSSPKRIGPPRFPFTWCLALAVLLPVLLGVIVYIATDAGTVTVEAPDDLKEGLRVAVLRNGSTVVDGWQIQPGANSHRLRTGSVELQLESGVGDSFELEPQGDLLVKRGGTVAYRLARRPAQTTTPITRPSATTEPPGSEPAMSPTENLALQFDGSQGDIVLPDLRRDDAQPFTIECRVRNVGNLVLPILRINGRAPVQLHLASLKPHGAERNETNKIARDVSGPQISASAWTHLAYVVDVSESRLFVDGRVIASKPGSPPVPALSAKFSESWIGNEVRDTSFPSRPFQGEIDEIRISRVTRYSKDYQPVHRHEPDAETLALYHCDEGQGAILQDSSGNNHHGQVTGIKWTRSGEPTLATAAVSTAPVMPQVQLTPAATSVSQPVPLADWLKGRKLRTVAQDGTGEFRTIQAALEAVQPGEVVEVLDRGPYRECVGIILPADVGLISRAGTILELTGTRPRPMAKGDTGCDHWLAACDRFRLHGFDIIAQERATPPSEGRGCPLVEFSIKTECVIEYCRFRSFNDRVKNIYLWCGAAWINPRGVFRNCVFEELLEVISGHGDQSQLLIEHNLFRRHDNLQPNLRLRGPSVTGGHVVIRRNVCDGVQTEPILLDDIKNLSSVEISDNTVLNGPVKTYGKTISHASVLRNVLAYSVQIASDGKNQVGDLSKWQFADNHIIRVVEAADRPTPAASDRTGPIPWLSTKPTDRDYLRLPATATEVGALPNGPAPSDGDWFTALQDLWKNGASPQPPEKSTP